MVILPIPSESNYPPKEFDQKGESSILQFNHILFENQSFLCLIPAGILLVYWVPDVGLLSSSRDLILPCGSGQLQKFRPERSETRQMLPHVKRIEWKPVGAPQRILLIYYLIV